MIAISALFLSGVWAIGVMGFAVALAVAVTVAARRSRCFRRCSASSAGTRT